MLTVHRDAAVESSDLEIADEEVTNAANTNTKRRARTRRFQQSTKGRLSIASKVLALFLIGAGYFILCFVLGENHLSVTGRLVPESIYAFRRLDCSRTMVSQVGMLAAAPVLQETEFRPNRPEQIASSLQVNLDEATRFHQGLLYGDPQWGLSGSLRRSAHRDDLAFGNACAFVNVEDMATLNALPIGVFSCEEFAQGIFRRGVSSAFIGFLSTIETFSKELVRLNEEQLNVTHIQDFFASDLYQEMDFSERFIMRYGLRLESKTYVEDLFKMNDDFLGVRIALLISFLCAVVGAYVVVYEPMIRALDNQLKNVRGMLLMIPMDIIESSTSLRRILIAG